MAEQRTYRFDDETMARAQALAEANFALPRGAGNVSALLRSLINQAWLYPERFGLIKPAAAVQAEAQADELPKTVRQTFGLSPTIEE
jgi:hypothetical protein